MIRDWQSEEINLLEFMVIVDNFNSSYDLSYKFKTNKLVLIHVNQFVNVYIIPIYDDSYSWPEIKLELFVGSRQSGNQVIDFLWNLEKSLKSEFWIWIIKMHQLIKIIIHCHLISLRCNIHELFRGIELKESFT